MFKNITIMVNERIFKVFENCKYVLGEKRIAIYDLKGKIHLLDAEYKEFVIDLFQNNVAESEVKTSNELTILCDYLIDKGLAFWCDSEQVNYFPVWNPEYDSPYVITNGIIDIQETTKFAEKFIMQLADILCPFVQIRFFPGATIEQLKEITSWISNYEVNSVQYLFPYIESVGFHSDLELIIANSSRVNEIIVYSTPVKDNALKGNTTKYIKYCSEQFSCVEDCGKVGPDYFVPNLDFFTEAKFYNTCLNRKISLSADGYLKNCPSFDLHYGHIDDNSILEVIEDLNFKKYWNIKKDDVEVCSKCEFRYACSDCRVYIEDKNNPYSKPIKCMYNPLK